VDFIPKDLRDGYEIYEWRNASVILGGKHEEEWGNMLEVLRGFRLKKSWITERGKNRSAVPKAIDGHFGSFGWKKRQFKTRITVDDDVYNSPTHEVDMCKGRVALEVEWNNKTEFYDRDLNNFRLLFELRVIDAGVIITRADDLRDIFKSLGPKILDKYGATTTHAGKLLPKIEGGGGGGCPVLVFAITKRLYDKDG
jgi:hypothetical protein